MRKKFLTACLAVLLAVGQAVPFTGTKEALAADITGHWAEPYMRKLVNYQVMRGDQRGNLNPDTPITRAEFVSMTNRAFGYDNYQDVSNPFKDVSKNDWYADDIIIAYDRGYFSGNSKNTADPNGDLTREQAVSLVCRNLKVDDYYGEVLGYSDSRTFSEWSKGAINTASQKGYVSGYTDGTFRPFNSITRGEAAKVFSDVVGELLQSPGSYSLGDVDGNVTISKSGITLRDTFINGDLYITGGIGAGHVNLENVHVAGEIIISGGGESHVADCCVTLADCTVNRLTVDADVGKILSVEALGSTLIRKTVVKTRAYFENYSYNYGFLDIELDGEPETELTLSGDYSTVTVAGPENYLVLGSGSIENLVVDESGIDSVVTLDDDTYVRSLTLGAPCVVEGNGEVSSLTVTSGGTTTEMLPDEITIRPGYVAKVDGRNMTSKDAEEASSYPRILANYPEEVEITPTGAEYNVRTNKPGTLYWAVVYEEDSGLSDSELMRPKNVKDILKSGTLAVKSSNTDVALKISGLKADTEYTLEAIFVDERSDVSRKKTEDFKTVDNLIPNFNSGYPTVKATTATTLVVDVVPTKDVTIYWGIFPKASQAPTDRELINDRLDGDVGHGKIKRAKKNEIETFTISGLEEKTEYDLYIVLSDGENVSAVKKLSATTKDVTPPKIIDGFPKSDKIADKAVDVRIKTDEDCTLHWVVVKRGTDYPPPVFPALTPPPLDSEEAKDAVVTGNNVLKSGRLALKADTEGMIKVSGLEPETSYDLYVAARDKSLNTSAVKKLTIKTSDIYPPRLLPLEFSSEINGEPRVESDITIWFNEEVWSRLTNKELEPETLADNIALYDVTEMEEKLMPIDYSKAEIGLDDEGKTFVKFPSAALDLNSGQRYQFEFNAIIDTSNNRMKDRTRGDVFKTVAPLVQLTRTEAPEDMDITFEMDPQAIKTADEVLFDMIFESDTTVQFYLYEKNEDGVFMPKDYMPTITENGATTLHYITDREDKVWDNPDDSGDDTNPDETQSDKVLRYKFEPFNELTKREYGIRFYSINGDTDRDSWGYTVKIGVKCVIGSKTLLSALAGNPKGGYASAIESGVTEVNYPKEFVLTAPFTDVSIPYFLEDITKPEHSLEEDGKYRYPRLEPKVDHNGVATEGSLIGDTLITPVIMTNKKCKFYYIIAPKGVIDPSNPPSALQVMSGALKPVDGVTGSDDIPSGNVETPVTIDGLKPETEYDMYYFLKGVPPEPSEVKYRSFKTLKVAPPVLRLQVVSRDEDSATVKIIADKNSSIDWVMVPQNSVGQWFDVDSEGKYTIKPSQIDTVKTVIRNGEETLGVKPVGFGSTKTTYSSSAREYSATVSVSGLERGIYYVLFAVARANLGGGEENVGGDSDIAFERNITPADVLPPTLVAKTVVTNADAKFGTAYFGRLSLSFNEELYYIPGDGTTLAPLTREVFEEYIECSAQKGTDVVVRGIENTRNFAILSYSTVKTDSGERAIRRIDIEFGNILHNDTIYFPYPICDASGNVAGKLLLTFVDVETRDPENPGYSIGRRDSHWEVRFLAENEEPY